MTPETAQSGTYCGAIAALLVRALSAMERGA